MALVLGFVLFALLDPPLGLLALVIGAVVEVGEAFFWTRYLRRFRVRTGAEGLLGKRAETIEPCNPGGRVKLLGEIWRAECTEGAGVGESVEVVSVEGLNLRVRPLQGPGTAQRR
ncbi:MAG: NfeD family protein [Solirubrobacterales bacterium]